MSTLMPQTQSRLCWAFLHGNSLANQVADNKSSHLGTCQLAAARGAFIANDQPHSIQIRRLERGEGMKRLSSDAIQYVRTPDSRHRSREGELHVIGIGTYGNVAPLKRYFRSLLLHCTADLRVRLIGIEAYGGASLIGRVL